MGEAKRRKAIDPNYGKPGYSYRAQKARAKLPHFLLDTLSSLPTAASEYEDCVRAIVAEHRAALLACATAAKADYPESAMCLIVLCSPSETERLTTTFCATIGVKTLWRRELRRRNQSDIMNVDELFTAALSKLEPEQFLWTHLDIDRWGIWARLVPIDEPNIALACLNDRSG